VYFVYVVIAGRVFGDMEHERIPARARQAVSVVGTAVQWFDVDVTAFVRARRAAGANAVTFALRSLTDTSAAAVVNSKEAERPAAAGHSPVNANRSR
jgi:hypothetical protein